MHTSDWEPARTAPLDGTPINCRFIDERGEYHGFDIYWDTTDKCWRNCRTHDRIMAQVSRWRASVPRHRRTA